MGKGVFDPNDIKISDFFFRFEHDVHDYVPETTSVQIFISISSAGVSPQIGEILRFYYSFAGWLIGYTVFFLGHAPRSNPWMHFHGLWLIYDVFSPKDGLIDDPFWACDNIGIHLGLISPKNPQKGRAQAISSQIGRI